MRPVTAKQTDDKGALGAFPETFLSHPFDLLEIHFRIFLAVKMVHYFEAVIKGFTVLLINFTCRISLLYEPP